MYQSVKADAVSRMSGVREISACWIMLYVGGG